MTGQPAYWYSYRTADPAIWNRILPSILRANAEIERVSSELWVGAADSFPHLIRHTLDLRLDAGADLYQIEINIYLYDFNRPLDLPGDLPS